MLSSRYFSLSILAIILVISINSCAPDEPKDKPRIDTIQTVIKKPEPPKEQEYQAPKELSYNLGNKKVLRDKFMPIGWSQAGTFAYVREIADEACYCFSMRVEILDVNTNQMKWKWEYTDQAKKENVNTAWLKNYKLIKQKLIENQIIYNEDFILKSPSFTYNNRNFSIKLDVKTTKEPYMDLDVVALGRISIENDGNEKDVAIVKEDNNLNILATQIAGFVKSPYEEKIAIVYKKERKGYEGPPHVSTYIVVGGNLKKMFP
jgi:hypothetical protein